MDFEAYLANLPMLHTWDYGKTWNTGGFSAEQLRTLHGVVTDHFGGRPVKVIETGAGNSTIMFLHLPLESLVSVAPAESLRDRILTYCTAEGVDVSKLDFRVARSELELAKMVLGSEKPGWGAPPGRPRFDVALIDGGHGWPTVFVDFCYLNMMLREGSLLLLDDVQLYSVAELSRLLQQQPGFELAHDLVKLQVWRKTDDEPFLPEHSSEPYILEMTRQASAAPAASPAPPASEASPPRAPGRESAGSRLRRRLSSRRA
jgi:hypothetical protein